MKASTRGYVNEGLLWSPEALLEQMNRPDLTIIDTRPAELFAKGHISGAKHFDLYFINTDDTDIAPLNSFTRMWANMLGWRGVLDTDTIVFYGEFTDMCAARGFWFLEYLGHTDVHILDGGIKAWETSGLQLETTCDTPTPSKFSFKPDMQRIATYIDVLNAINNSDCAIIDNRSHDEFIGADQRARFGGAIPSAQHRDWEDLYDHNSGCMKSAEELQLAFGTLGVDQKKEIILYCNTGYRSAHAYLALRLLDYPRVRNYLGSWQEWGNREGLPIEKFQ
jgi:thiosulfate/3-mercaptopyruvate sulfurtransferase